MTNFQLPLAAHHPDWYDKEGAFLLHGDLSRTRPDDLASWTVQLLFKQGSSSRTGAGFFLNVPDILDYIILTAGHNLIDNERRPSEDLRVRLRWRAGQDPPCETEAQPGMVYISKAYEEGPGEHNAVHDWGAIRLTKPPGAEKQGFGFSLQLCDYSLEGESLELNAWQKGSDGPSRNIKTCDDETGDQLRYEFSTRPGMSGSPVFVHYRGQETAVAIHTYGPKFQDDRSKGTRLSMELLTTVFDWTGALRRREQLRVFDEGDHDCQDLYLHFLPERGSARIRKALGGVNTSFDIYPAYSPPSSVPHAALYAFQYLQASGKAWFSWKVRQQRIDISNQLVESCLVRIEYDQTDGEAQNARLFRLLIESKKQSIQEVRVDMHKFIQEDFEDGDPDFPGIAFTNMSGFTS